MIVEKVEKTLKNGKKVIYFSPTLEDCEGVLNLRNKSVKETNFLSRGKNDADGTMENQRKRISDAIESQTNFAKVDDEFVGLGQIYQKSSFLKYKHRCELGIFVRKSHWRQRIGNDLMKIIIENCKKIGYEQIELEIFEENLSALNLYKKFGFKKCGKIKNGVKYSEDNYTNMVIMQKFIKGVNHD